MKEKFKKICNCAKKTLDKTEALIYRPFDLTFAFKKNKNPSSPVLTVNLKGEVSKRLVLFFTVVGAFVTAFAVVKVIKAIKDIF